jgi:hypothetical protein
MIDDVERRQRIVAQPIHEQRLDLLRSGGVLVQGTPDCSVTARISAPSVVVAARSVSEEAWHAEAERPARKLRRGDALPGGNRHAVVIADSGEQLAAAAEIGSIGSIARCTPR